MHTVVQKIFSAIATLGIFFAFLIAPVTKQATPHAKLATPTKTLSLTFDADMTHGMQARLRAGTVKEWYDPALIAFLRKEKIPSTVFMTGLFAETYPDLAKSLAHDPLFSIQNHSYDHAAFESPCYGLPSLSSDAEKRAELTKTQDDLARIADAHPTLFRYPGLCHNAHDDALVAEAGLSVSDSDIISGDAFAKNAERVAETIIAHAHDRGEVVMHLGGHNAPVTAAALEKAVPVLRAAGYTFVFPSTLSF